MNVSTVGTPRSDSIVTLRQRYSTLPLQDQKSLTTIWFLRNRKNNCVRKDSALIYVKLCMYEEEQTSTIRDKLRNEVDTFINRDDNSITCPDKSETRLRYQLDRLQAYFTWNFSHWDKNFAILQVDPLQ